MWTPPPFFDEPGVVAEAVCAGGVREEHGLRGGPIRADRASRGHRSQGWDDQTARIVRVAPPRWPRPHPPFGHTLPGRASPSPAVPAPSPKAGPLPHPPFGHPLPAGEGWDDQTALPKWYDAFYVSKLTFHRASLALRANSLRVLRQVCAGLTLSSRAPAFRLFWAGRGGASRAATATKLPLFTVALRSSTSAESLAGLALASRNLAAGGGVAQV
jgi:hypothetical protein